MIYMNCPKCGAKIEKEWGFCPKCGSSLRRQGDFFSGFFNIGKIFDRFQKMQEETGYLPHKVTRLTSYYSSPGFCTELLHLYLAEDMEPSRLVAEDTEGITVVRIKPDEISESILSGRICDAKSIAGLYTWLDYRKSD